MTVISAETLTRSMPRRASTVSSNSPLVRDVKDGVVRLTSNPDEAIQARPIPTRSSSRILPPRRGQPTNLVEEFIRSCKDLEAYKSVSHFILLIMD